MRTLVLLPDQDRPGRGDYHGAFLPEAQRLAALHQVLAEDVVEVPIRAPEATQRQAIQLAVQIASTPGPLDWIAFVCHGVSRSRVRGCLRKAGWVTTCREGGHPR